MTLIVGHSGKVALGSVNDADWDIKSLGDLHEEIRAVVKAKSGWYYAFSSTGRIYLSKNEGGYWTPQNKTFDRAAVRAATYNGDIIIALTDGWMGGLRSGYGWREWRQWNSGQGIFGIAGLLEDETPENIGDVRWVLVGDGGRVQTASGWAGSPGWLLWTDRSNPSQGRALFGVARGDGRWVVGGEGGFLMTSETGESWTTLDSPFNGSHIYSVRFHPILGWIAVGAENTVALSNDGLRWTTVDMPASGECAGIQGVRIPHRWLDAVVENDCWVVVGDDNIQATVCECSGYYTVERYMTVMFDWNPLHDGYIAYPAFPPTLMFTEGEGTSPTVHIGLLHYLNGVYTPITTLGLSVVVDVIKGGALYYRGPTTEYTIDVVNYTQFDYAAYIPGGPIGAGWFWVVRDSVHPNTTLDIRVVPPGGGDSAPVTLFMNYLT